MSNKHNFVLLLACPDRVKFNPITHYSKISLNYYFAFIKVSLTNITK